MTKWGMPGVYTHAFMDGWSPGYLGSVAYNHNGMMRMYETQGGNDVRAGRRHAGGRGAARRCSRRRSRRRSRSPLMRPDAAGAPAAERRRASAPTGRGGGQPREWYRGIPIPPGALDNFRAATTRTTWRPASSPASS